MGWRSLALVTATCLAAATSAACASNSGGTSEPVAGDGPGCDRYRHKLERLYRLEDTGDQTGRELRAEIVDANVHMVLGDCRRQPARVMACLETADTIEIIESRCVIPLDDRGETEARQLGDS